jgi:putative flippase GtrA
MKKSLRQFILFIAIGVLNTGTTLTLVFLLLYFTPVHQLLANFIGYAAGLTISYFLNRRFTFGDQGKPSASGIRFIFAAMMAYSLNIATILLSESLLHLSIYLAQIAGNVIYTLSMFAGCKLFVFRASREGSAINPSWVRCPGILKEGFLDVHVRTVGLISLALWILLSDSHGFGPFDDHQFARTILQGKPFGFYFSETLGRFYPLVAQEYVLASWILGHEEQILYRIGMAKLPLLGLLMAFVIRSTGLRGLPALMLSLSAIFSLGVANTLYRLHAGDLNALIFLLGYIGLTLKFGPESETKKSHHGLLGFLTFFLAVIASLYKETISVLLFTFSACEILRLALLRPFHSARKALPVFIYSGLFLLTYKLWLGGHQNANYADLHALPREQVLFGYLANDPLFLVVGFPLLIARIWLIATKRSCLSPFDSMLCAALAYASAFCVLSMYNHYYLLPAYGFLLLALAGLYQEIRVGFFRALFVTLVAACLIFNLPVYLSDVLYQKRILINHSRFIQFLPRWINTACPTEGPACNIILEGVDAGSGVESLVSFQSFLQLAGIQQSRYRLLAGRNSDAPTLPGLGLDDTQAHAPHQGDFILKNPYQGIRIQLTQKPSEERIYQSQRDLSPVRWRLDEWVTACWSGLDSCKLKSERGQRYVGYALFRKSRETIPFDSAQKLKSPTYALDIRDLSGILPKNKRIQINATLRNEGHEPWPSPGVTTGINVVNLAYRWTPTRGHLMIEGERTPLPETLLQGESFTTSLEIKTPEKAGFYALDITPVQEGNLWFPTHFTRMILIE